MKEAGSKIIPKIEQKTQTLLNETGKVMVLSSQREVPSNKLKGFNQRVDLVMNVKSKNGKNYKLVFEIKSLGQPRYIRLAVNQLQSLMSNEKNCYGIVGAPYISDEAMKICKENKMGCIDVAGNSLLDFDNIYLCVQGNLNPYSTTRPQKSLFTRKTTRILRALLYHPQKKWTLVELSKEAQVSLGQVANVKKKLLDYEYIREDQNKKMTLQKPEDLLKKWTENYSYSRNELNYFYSLDPADILEKKISDYCNVNKINYAFTLTSGANLIQPFLRYSRVFFYLDSTGIENLTRELGWKKVESGPNITVLNPYDEGVFYGIQNIDTKNVVSDIQLYLDLVGYKERGQEAAEKILENRIKPKW